MHCTVNLKKYIIIIYFNIYVVFIDTNTTGKSEVLLVIDDLF